MVQFIIPCDIARLKCLYFFLLLMSEYGFGRVRRVLHAACCGFYAAKDYFFSLFFFSWDFNILRKFLSISPAFQTVTKKEKTARNL